MQYAFTASNDGLWDWDILNDKIYFSPRWKEIIGYQDREVEYTVLSSFDTLHSDDLFGMKEKLEQAFAQRDKYYEMEFRQRHKDGHYIWVLSRAIIEYNEIDVPIRMIGTHTDITQMKESYEASLKYQRLLNLSTDMSTLAFWELDLKTNTFTLNDLYYKFLATTAEDEGGYVMDVKTYLEAFVPPESQQAVMNNMGKAFEKNSDYACKFEYEMRRRDGKILPVEVNCYVSYDAHGKPDKSYGTKYILENQKDRENELQHSKEKIQMLLEEQNTLLSLFDKGDSVLFKWKNDEHWSVEHVSNSVTKLLSLTAEDIMSGKTVYASCIHKDDLKRVMEEVRTAVRERQDFFQHQPYRIITQDNHIKWVSDYTVTEKDEEGNITYFIGYITDISEAVQSERKIKQYLSLIDENIISSTTDLNGIITDISSAFCELSGYTKDELIGNKHKILRDPETKQSLTKNMWDTITRDEKWKGECRNIKKDGSYFWIKVTILPVFDEDGSKTGYVGIAENITDKKIIEHLSITDDLTKLYNRRHFNDVFEKEINRTKRDNNTITFVMLDVDNFKLYNDTYGHQKGDTVLRQIAKVIKEHTKRGGDYAFRLGGEEFGMVFTSEKAEELKTHVVTIIEAIEALNIPHDSSTISKYVTASAGIVSKKSTDIISANALYKKADDALYTAKENGKNQVKYLV